MEFSRKKEVLTIIVSGIVSGLVSFVLIAVAIGFYILAQAPCAPIGLALLVTYFGGWMGLFIGALIIGGYGAFVGWIGFRDFTSTKKLSVKAVILTIIGLLGICAFLLPVCD